MPASSETSGSERVELEPMQPATRDAPAITSQALVERLPIVITVELGRTNVSVKELKNLRKGQILGLDKAIGEAFGIYANGQKLATGEIVSIAEQRYGVRVVAVVEEGDQSVDAFP